MKISIAPIKEYESIKADFSLELLTIRKLWENAFYGDIVYYNGAMLAVFRNATTHAGSGGKITILRSVDEGETWDHTATLAHPDLSLFGPHFCVLADGRLMLNGGTNDGEGTKTDHFGSCVAFSSDGLNWSPLKIILGQHEWLWRMTAHPDGYAYGVVHRAAPSDNRYSRLVGTRDGLKIEVVTDLLKKDFPGEATIRFAPDKTAYMIHRHDGGSRHALIGTSKPPYKVWSWKDLGQFIGGPNLMLLPNGRWLAGGRYVEEPVRLQLGQVNVETGEYYPVLDLLSGGDCSYPGFLAHTDRLWVTYYSSHEGVTSFYLAELNIVATQH